MPRFIPRSCQANGQNIVSSVAEPLNHQRESWLELQHDYLEWSR